jgi:hypothetical protein
MKQPCDPPYCRHRFTAEAIGVVIGEAIGMPFVFAPAREDRWHRDEGVIRPAISSIAGIELLHRPSKD